MSTIDARVRNIESALAEFLHATAASIPVPASRSGMKRTCEDAGLPSSPAPTSTNDEINSDISQAGKLCSDALSPSLPTLNISTLTALCAADELMAEPTTEPTPTTATPQPEPTAAMSTGKPGAAAPRAAATSPTAPVPPQPSFDLTHIRPLYPTDRLHPTDPPSDSARSPRLSTAIYWHECPRDFSPRLGRRWTWPGGWSSTHLTNCTRLVGGAVLGIRLHAVHCRSAW